MKGRWPCYVVLQIVTMALFFQCTRAEADTRLELGAGFLSWEYSDGGAAILTERFNGKYDVSLGIVTEQYCRCTFPTDIDDNLFVQVQRVFVGSRFELGIGAAWFQNSNRALGKRFNVPLSLGYRLTKRISLRVRHYSNGGSGVPNVGQDLITVGYRFG